MSHMNKVIKSIDSQELKNIHNYNNNSKLKDHNEKNEYQENRRMSNAVRLRFSPMSGIRKHKFNWPDTVNCHVSQNKNYTLGSILESEYEECEEMSDNEYLNKRKINVHMQKRMTVIQKYK